jgi:hypothetical protein
MPAGLLARINGVVSEMERELREADQEPPSAQDGNRASVKHKLIYHWYDCVIYYEDYSFHYHPQSTSVYFNPSFPSSILIFNPSFPHGPHPN